MPIQGTHKDLLELPFEFNKEESIKINQEQAKANAVSLVTEYLDSLVQTASSNPQDVSKFDEFFFSKNTKITPDFYIVNSLEPVKYGEYIKEVSTHSNLSYTFDNVRAVNGSRKGETTRPNQFDITVKANLNPQVGSNPSYSVPLNFVIRFSHDYKGFGGFKISQIIHENSSVIIPNYDVMSPISSGEEKSSLEEEDINTEFRLKSGYLVKYFMELIEQQASGKDKKEEILRLFYDKEGNQTIEVSSLTKKRKKLMKIVGYPKHLQKLGYDSVEFEMRNFNILEFPSLKEKNIWIGQIEYTQGFKGKKKNRNYKDLANKKIEVYLVKEQGEFKAYFGDIKVISTSQWKKKKKPRA